MRKFNVELNRSKLAVLEAQLLGIVAQYNLLSEKLGEVTARRENKVNEITTLANSIEEAVIASTVKAS